MAQLTPEEEEALRDLSVVLHSSTQHLAMLYQLMHRDTLMSELRDASGFSQAHVSNFLADLRASGLLRERRVQLNPVGTPSKLYRVDRVAVLAHLDNLRRILDPYPDVSD